MRVIAGIAKGRRLESVPGTGTRPITDRAKEALFNILGDEIVNARVLDLFGGTGAVGIEALSRGAREVVFVERARSALRVLGHNLQRTGLAEGARVVRGDAFRYLQQPQEEPFDLIYVAPPQYQRLWLRALRLIDARPELLAPGGLVVVQIHPKEFDEVGLASLQRVDTRQYGSVRLDFYEREREPA
ncbi:MAG: 16S rRNA (guanine(966)-N(2))-methyltransferase RsmD [Caldilineae bacterium]|nr:MAG: 16S rRNA (guanine(966)-N(2))-methyltransferase RsmD [Caldilineae bacterium]